MGHKKKRYGKLITDEEFEQYTNRKLKSRNNMITKNFETIKNNQYTNDFTSEKRRAEIKPRPLWNDEEIEMAQIARLSNDPDVYINYLNAKAKRK